MSSRGRAAGNKRPRPAEAGVGAGASASAAKAPRRSDSASSGGRGRGRGRGGKSEGSARKGSAPPVRSKKLDENIDFDYSSDEDGSGSGGEAAAPEPEAETVDAARMRMSKELVARYTAEAKGEDAEGSGDDADVKDAVSKRLMEDSALATSTALVFPYAHALSAWCAKGQHLRAGVFRKGHNLSATSVCLSPDGRTAFTGSKDCSIIQWDTSVFLKDAPSRPASASGSGSGSGEGSGKAADWGRVCVRKVAYPGRRRNKADVAMQQRAAAKAQSHGLTESEEKGIFTGLRSVLSPGYGGGRIGGDAPRGGLSRDPKIIHRDGVSSIVVTKIDNSKAARAAVLKKLRTVPDYGIPGHWAEVLCLAVSSDGRYMASGGKDRIVRVWDISAPFGAAPCNEENFIGHKDTVTGVVFRRGTHQLYSCGTDRLVKLWSLDEMSYVDTLFGHQSDIIAIDAVAGKERCVTAGRDRTVRLWKVPEQTQLVFRAHASDVSTDAVAAINESWFLSGGADGSLSLWHSTKKKPSVTIHAAHKASPSLPPPTTTSTASTAGASAGGEGAVAGDGSAVVADSEPLPPTCNWITALAICPNSDMFATGSGDGFIRIWQLETPHSHRPVGKGGVPRDLDSPEALYVGLDAQRPTAFTGITELCAIPVTGVVNGLSFSYDGKLLAAAVGQEHRLGRWWHDATASNGIFIVRLPGNPGLRR